MTLTSSSLAESTADSKEQITIWSDGLLKRLANTWRGTLLTMESDSQDLTAPDTASALCSDLASALSSELNGQNPENFSKILSKTELILSAFLASKSVITNIDRNGLVDLTTFAVRSAIDPPNLQDLELRIGFGASPTEIPNARIPAYILAAKNILTSLRDPDANQTDRLPKVILYSASKFVETINNGDSEKVARAAQRNFDLIRLYLDRFAPELISSFDFDEDRPIKSRDPLSTLIGFYAKALETTIDPAACAAREKVIGMGAKYGSTAQNAQRYAAAHTLYAADPIAGPAATILQRSEPRPRNLMMIGGEPEKTFWRVRETVKRGVTIQSGIAYFRELLNQIDCPFDSDGPEVLLARFMECSTADAASYLRAQLISSAGQMPVYGMYKGDWSLRDIAEKSFDDLIAAPFDLRMKRDLLAVLCDIAGLPLEKAYAMTNKKPLDPETREQLAKAYKQYSDFCREFLTRFSF